MSRQRSSVVGAAGSSATAAPSANAHLENSVLAYISADAAALNCDVCCLPLKPPIFQCKEGHCVCSPCRGKLASSTGKCHECGADTSWESRGYRRCHAMERVVESVRVPCPNAAYGCTATPAYCDHLGHIKVCLRAPCHCYCPGEACRFAGPMEALLDHLAAGHGWRQPSDAAKVRAGVTSFVQLNDGFNFFILDDDKQGATTAAASNGQFLILLEVARQLLSCAISVLLIHPHAAASGDGQRQCLKTATCELTYSLSGSLGCRSDLLIDRDLRSEIRMILCTDLSNGLPAPGERFQFLVPNTLLLSKEKENNAINVGFKLWFV